MNLPLIGVMGCGGAVGRAAATALLRDGGLRLRGGHRNATARSGPGFERVTVDAEQPGALARFCAGCRVVLNCAGPSCLIGDRVAQAATSAGADYVDAFGSIRLERQIARWADQAGQAFVVSAGIFPGLSGLLPRWLAIQAFDRVERMRAFAGGREPCSWGGGADVLLSSLDGFGSPGAVWAGGRVLAGAASVLDDVELPGFPGRVHARPFLSQETERVAASLGLGRAEWYSVTPSVRIPEAITRACANLSMRGADDRDALAQSVAELIRIAELEMAGRAPFYVMSVEMEGLWHGRPVCRRAVLRAADSYRLSGEVAALAVRSLLEGPRTAGVRWAAESIDPDRAIETIRSLGEVDLHLAEVSPRDAVVEEGMI